MQVTAETPRTEATIAGTIFNIATPFAEGHTISANEASALNQVLIENVRNNMATKVKAGGEEGGVAVVQADVDTYVETYEFGVRRGGGGVSADPVTKEAMDIARGLVKKALQNKGHKLADIAAADITRLAKDALAGEKGELIRKKAAKIVKEREGIGADELSLDI